MNGTTFQVDWGGKGINVVEALSSARVIYAVKHNSNKQLLIKT